jgi:hypothetical protein
MVAARKLVTMRAFVIALLYELCDQELNDWPERRYQTKRGQGQALFIGPRRYTCSLWCSR